MSKRQMLMILGVWIIIFLFLGFPSAWDKALAIVSGLLIVMFAYSVHSGSRDTSAGNVPYVEHRSKPAMNKLSEQTFPSAAESAPEDIINNSSPTTT